MKFINPILWCSVLACAGSALAQGPVTQIVSSIALAKQPAVSALSAIVVDAETGKVLWEKDADTKRFPASTTKIMTAMLLLEHCTTDDIIVAPKDIDKVNQASMHLHPGEKIKAGDMLYAILLRSANDGCVATAIHIAGSVPKFAELMNKRAKELGCTNTNFSNPNGLNDDSHVTTARDLAIIGRAAMKYPAFAQAVKTYKYNIERDKKISKDTLMINHNKALLQDPTMDGMKTGWTIPAGRCFVGSATRNGYRIITVVLKSQDWKKDTLALFDWAYSEHVREPLLRPGQTLGPIPVDGGAVNEVALLPSAVPVHLWKKGASKKLDVRFDHPARLAAPVKKGQKVGSATFTDSSGFSQSIDLLAAEDVQQTFSSKFVGGASSAPGVFLIGGFMGVGAYWYRLKTRKRVRRVVRKQAFASAE